MKIIYKCLKCGHTFLFVKGDFIHDRRIPVCPECGSRLVIHYINKTERI